MYDIRKMLNNISAGITTLVLKIGPKILTIVAKFAKIGKFGLAAVSMVSYAYLFTWKFAIMIMVLLLVHEYGHIWAMKRCGLSVKGIYFIPFLGAAAVTEEMFKSRRDEAYIAIMGPIFGFALSGIALVVYIVTQNALFGAAAGWMAMINLFNLLPINPLDGGRIMKSIAFSINSKFGYIFLAIGIVASIILIFWAGILLFLLLLIIGTLEFIFEFLIRNENIVIKRCIKDVDKIFDKNRPVELQRAVDNVKGILSDKKVDPIVRINTIISIGEKFRGEGENIKSILSDEKLDLVTRVNSVTSIEEKFRDEDGIIDFHTGGLSLAISPLLKRFDHMPRMTSRGVVITSIAYVGTIVMLWVLMTYASHIPEVEIARKFFMS
jgi:Zn-dependent protease